MSHFVLCACKTLTARADILHMWQHAVPNDAVSHPFLMHGILSFSALHLAYLHKHTSNSPELRLRYARLAQHHQSEAIPEFRRALGSLSPESAGPCFAMGSILASLAVAGVSDNRLDLLLVLPEEPGPNSSSSPVTFDTILSIFTLTRGIRGILNPAWVWDTFSTSAYGVAAHGHGNVADDALELPAPSQSIYTRLREKIRDRAEFSDAQKSACLEALQECESIERTLRFYHHRKLQDRTTHTESSSTQPLPLPLLLLQVSTCTDDNNNREKTTSHVTQPKIKGGDRGENNTGGGNNKVVEKGPGEVLEASLLFKWVAMVPDEFFALLTARDVLAVEILRGFISLMELLDISNARTGRPDGDDSTEKIDAWYLERFMENSFGAIDSLSAGSSECHSN